jgi:hypothetical protein
MFPQSSKQDRTTSCPGHYCEKIKSAWFPHMTHNGEYNIPLNRNSVPNILRINALHSTKRVRGADAPSISLVAVEREVLLRLRRLSSIVAENAGPLLDGLLVVLRAQSRVGAAVVDLEARAGAGVARVHVLDCVGPVLGGGDDGALGAGGVPGCGLVGGGDLLEGRGDISEMF